MNCFELYKMIFYVFDNEFDGSKDEKLGELCSSMNPFLFEGEGSAVAEIYDEFKREFEVKFKDKCTVEQGYEYGKIYAEKTKINAAIEAFKKISIDDWKDAYNEIK